MSKCWTNSHWQGESQSGLLPGQGTVLGSSLSSALRATSNVPPLPGSPRPLRPSGLHLARFTHHLGPPLPSPRSRAPASTSAQQAGNQAGRRAGAGVPRTAPPSSRRPPGPLPRRRATPRVDGALRTRRAIAEGAAVVRSRPLRPRGALEAAAGRPGEGQQQVTVGPGL